MSGGAAMDVDGEGSEINRKITILPGYASDLSAATFCLNEEDHTLGNSLRWMLMRDPDVEFCGYSNPHPSEHKIHLRLQMYDGQSVLPALRNALNNLSSLFTTIGDKYDTALQAGEYERYQEKKIDPEWLKEFAEKGKQRRAEAAEAAEAAKKR